MNDAAYARWLSQFVEFGDQVLTREEWKYHPSNPQRIKRPRQRPPTGEVEAAKVKMYPPVEVKRHG